MSEAAAGGAGQDQEMTMTLDVTVTSRVECILWGKVVNGEFIVSRVDYGEIEPTQDFGIQEVVEELEAVHKTAAPVAAYPTDGDLSTSVTLTRVTLLNPDDNNVVLVSLPFSGDDDDDDGSQ